MKIKDIVKECRPRERFIVFGGESLSEAELLAIILGNGTIGENAVEMSNRILSKCGIGNLFNSSIKELMEIKGIGKEKAIKILSVGELSKRVNLFEFKKRKIINAKDVYEIFKDKFNGKKKESFHVVLLDTKNNIINTEEISVGILDASIVHPREVFCSAIKSCASRIILVHNHPSGDSQPSEEDLGVTKKLIDVGELVGIEVLDHVIVGDKEYWSYVEG